MEAPVALLDENTVTLLLGGRNMLDEVRGTARPERGG